LVESPTLEEFVEAYLAQHEGEPDTTAKLRWLLRKAVRAFGDRRPSELRSPPLRRTSRLRLTPAPAVEREPGCSSGESTMI